MNDKQARFVQEYLIDLNATQAAIRAGYSKRTAYSQGQRLLKNAEVAAAVNKQQARVAEKAEVDQEWVVRKIIDTIERCGQAHPVVDRNGKPVMVETPDGTLAAAYTFDAGNVLRGTDQLMKHLGGYEQDNRQKTDPIRALLTEIAGAAKSRGVLDSIRARTRGEED